MSIENQTNILTELQKPFEPHDLEWRVQRSLNTKGGPKAIVVPYIQNRAIMSRLDQVFGPGGWKNEYVRWSEKGVLCGISAKIDGEWVTKWDGAEETNIESVKGGLSAAMKRSAVQWGIGRYLYDFDEVWVDIKDRGENYIKDAKNNIQGYWDTPTTVAPKQPKPQVQKVSEPAPKPTAQQQAPVQTASGVSKDPNAWDPADINKLKELKTILGITDNPQLDPFVREFLDSADATYRNVTPQNVKAFNVFLAKKAGNA